MSSLLNRNIALLLSKMDQNTFDVKIDNFQKFAKEIFAPGCEDKFKVQLMEELNQIMKMGQNLNTQKVSMVESMEFCPTKKIKLDASQNTIPDLPNEIWTKIIKRLPAKDVYGTLTLVNKRFQSLALESGVLRLIEINLQNNQKAMNILKHSTAPMKLICEDSYEASKAVLVTQNLKSLEFRNTHWKNFRYRDPYDEEFDYLVGKPVGMDLITALKRSNVTLEHLELTTGFYLTPNARDEISKMKTLKTFKISDARMVVITPDIVKALAKSENPFENVEFNDFVSENQDSYFRLHDGDTECCKLKKAMNEFLRRKSNTLKSLKHITWDGKVYDYEGEDEYEIDDEYEDEIFLKNLKLCQNLEEFCGTLPSHDIKFLAELPRLQKLKLTNLKDPKYLLDHLNLDSLKFLSISGYKPNYRSRQTSRRNEDEAKRIISQELPMYKFPVLERLFINEPPELTEEFFSNLISNAPNLKSIHLNASKCPVSYQFMNDFFKKSNIFVCFNSKSFEEFLIENDLIVFRKYHRMKKSYSEWSSNNSEYAS